jgi:hypothetical protein
LTLIEERAMKTRAFVLAGVSLVILAAPAVAGRSTTAERETTDSAPSVESASIANPDGAARAILSSIQKPPTKIATANVLDASGQAIGAVQRVEVTPNGMPTKVAVALTGKEGKVTVLDADRVKYDPVKNEILAQQSGAEIRSQATGETG